VIDDAPFPYSPCPSGVWLARLLPRTWLGPPLVRRRVTVTDPDRGVDRVSAVLIILVSIASIR